MTEIEILIGFYILMILLSYVILTPNKKQLKIKHDEDALQIVREILEKDEVRHYEIVSIVRMKETHTTTIIVETNVSDIVLEIDNITGTILNKEKLIV